MSARVVIATLLRLGLAALLVYAGGMKLGDPGAFAEEIANYRLLPAIAPLVAHTLPCVEIVCGLGLLAPGAWRAGAALLAVGMMLVFTLAVASAWLRGVDVRCGCFGASGGPIDALTVLRDLALLAIAAYVLREAAPQRSRE